MTRAHDNRDYIQLVAESAPDPIRAQGSRHKAVLDNHTSQNLFQVEFTFSLKQPGDQHLAFGQAGCTLWSHSGGRAAAGRSLPASVGVILVNPPASPVVADIDTTATWTLSASQPQNGKPAKPYKRHCVPTLTAG